MTRTENVASRQVYSMACAEHASQNSVCFAWRFVNMFAISSPLAACWRCKSCRTDSQENTFYYVMPTLYDVGITLIQRLFGCAHLGVVSLTSHNTNRKITDRFREFCLTQCFLSVVVIWPRACPRHWCWYCHTRGTGWSRADVATPTALAGAVLILPHLQHWL